MTTLAGVKLDRVDATELFALGTVYEAHNGKAYKYITYSEEAAATDGVLGEVCYYVSDTGYLLSDVTSDLTASDELGAGVLQATLSDNEFGWIQVRGPATLSIALTADEDGSALTPTGSADGTLDIAIDTTASSSTNICAYAGDASAKEIMCAFVN